MPRFVILRHELPLGSPRGSHYDLMLERDGVLLTWTCVRLPEPGQSVDAERLADHRLAYLDYEGLVSSDRGSVTRVVAGEYELLAEGSDGLFVRLIGTGLSGGLMIKELSADPQRWCVSLAEG